jgi:hypothetical protein
MGRLSRIVDALDRVPPLWLLAVNAFIALFVLSAHGGWLLLIRAGKGTATEADVGLVYVTIPVAAVALLLALGAFAIPSTRLWVLRAQAVLLLGFVLFLLQVAWSIIAHGIPASGRFAWNPALFAFLLAYPVYLARRTLFPSAAATQLVPRYSHIIALLASLLISVFVIYRAAP